VERERERERGEEKGGGGACVFVGGGREQVSNFASGSGTHASARLRSCPCTNSILKNRVQPLFQKYPPPSLEIECSSV
jgi:hypothetical protein